MRAMPNTTDLEAQLEALTREFVGQLVAAIRNASFADVAALSARYTPNPGAGALHPGAPHRKGGAAARTPRGEPGAEVRPDRDAASGSRRVRQTAERRAELSDRVVKALQGAGGALGVRALSTALGVPPDVLATPLRELRDKGLIHKHGDKRATTYSA
jgi:hypothetical protein